MKYFRQFGAFLYDFLVGDAWELFVGPLVALVIAAAMLHVVGSAVAGALLFLIVLVVAAVNITVALRESA